MSLKMHPVNSSDGTGTTEHSEWTNRRPILIRKSLLLLIAGAAVVWAIIRVGPRIPFPTAWYLDDRWPYLNLDELQAYKRTSPVGYILAELLRLDQSPLLVLFYFAAALGATLLIAFWVWSELRGSSQRNRGFRIAILAPISGVLYLTLGGYDPFTALGWGMALFAWTSKSRILMVFAGFYLGFQHFEQAALMVISLSMAVYALRSASPANWLGRHSLLWLFPGVVAGKFFLSILLMVLNADPLAGRGFWVASRDLTSFAVVGSLNFGPIFIYSLFAGVWAIVIIAYFLLNRHSDRLWLACSIAIPGIVSVLTLDHTRVFVLMTVPLVALLMVFVLGSPKISIFTPVPLLLEALAWVLVPVTIQGTSSVYVDSFNALDMTLIFVRQLLGMSPIGS